MNVIPSPRLLSSSLVVSVPAYLVNTQSMERQKWGSDSSFGITGEDSRWHTAFENWTNRIEFDRYPPPVPPQRHYFLMSCWALPSFHTPRIPYLYKECEEALCLQAFHGFPEEIRRQFADSLGPILLSYSVSVTALGDGRRRVGMHRRPSTFICTDGIAGNDARISTWCLNLSDLRRMYSTSKLEPPKCCHRQCSMYPYNHE
jgi:hypothetical protein